VRRADRSAPNRDPGTDSPADAGRSASPGGLDRPERDRAGWLVGGVLAVVLGGLGCLRHRNVWTGGFDLGVFDQGIWLLSQGLAPEVTVNGRNLFADHLSVVTLAFVPLYRLSATPYWLFAAQGLALGANVLAFRALARHEGAPVWLATLFAVFGAPLLAAAVFEFHPATLAVPFVSWALLEARRGNVGRLTVAAALIMLCRSELAIVLLGIAVVARPEVRRRLLVMAPLGLAAGYIGPALLGARGTFEVHYGNLGTSPKDALLHPWRIPLALLHPTSLVKWVWWLAPVGFLPLRRPRWLLALGVAALPVLLSGWWGTATPWFHYHTPFFPLAVGGALAALGRDGAASPRPGSPAAFAALPRPTRTAAVCAVVAPFLIGPLAPYAPDRVRVWSVIHPEPHDYAEALAEVRPGEPVAATNHALAQLTHRREAWLLPVPFAPGEVPELDADPSPEAAARVAVVITADGPHASEAERRLPPP